MIKPLLQYDSLFFCSFLFSLLSSDALDPYLDLQVRLGMTPPLSHVPSTALPMTSSLTPSPYPFLVLGPFAQSGSV